MGGADAVPCGELDNQVPSEPTSPRVPVPASDDRKHYCSRCLTTFAEDLDQCPNLACRRKRPSRGWGVIFADGDVFDRTYRIHRMLAVGGAGVTYLGRELDGSDEQVGPRIAIKVLLAARDQGPYVRRLATEAQIIQELDHPNIVQYLGFVHRSGHSPYLLTRFEAGGSLLDHMRRVGTLTVKQAALVGRQICWALEKAHERDIVHRDLKPENVLLTRVVEPDEDPVVRVADFGIAKVQGSLGTNLTRVGAFVGTPHYAAPEQFVGGAVTEAADVYAVGALLYFTMTAKHVVRFADRIDPEDGFQLLCDNLPPRLERPMEHPDAIRRMQKVLAAAMEVDPLSRCSVVELDEMLQSVAADQEPVRPPSAGQSEPVNAPAGASVLGMAAVASPPPAAPVGLADRAAHIRAREGDSGAAPGPETLSETSATEGFGRPVATESSGSPTVEDPTAATEKIPDHIFEDDDPKGTGGRSWGMLFLGLVVFVGGGLVLAAGGVVALLMWLQPGWFGDDPGSTDGTEVVAEAMPDAPVLVPDSKANERDLHVVRKSLDSHKRTLKKACGVSGGQQAEITFAVDGTGTVLGAEGDGQLALCVAEALVGMHLERTENRTVKLTYAFVW